MGLCHRLKPTTLETKLSTRTCWPATSQTKIHTILTQEGFLIGAKALARIHNRLTITPTPTRHTICQIIFGYSRKQVSSHTMKPQLAAHCAAPPRNPGQITHSHSLHFWWKHKYVDCDKKSSAGKPKMKKTPMYIGTMCVLRQLTVKAQTHSTPCDNKFGDLLRKIQVSYALGKHAATTCTMHSIDLADTLCRP